MVGIQYAGCELVAPAVCDSCPRACLRTGWGPRRRCVGLRVTLASASVGGCVRYALLHHAAARRWPPSAGDWLWARGVARTTAGTVRVLGGGSEWSLCLCKVLA